MMTDERNRTYEDTHARLVKNMQEACEKNESCHYPPPEKDLSFLYKDKNDKKSRFASFNKFNKVAAIIIIILLSANIVLLVTGSNDVYSDKGILHRIQEGAKGIFTDSEDSVDIKATDIGDLYIIDNWKDIDISKNYWPNICIPGYIPDGFEFEYLRIYKDGEGDYRAEYKFYDDVSEILISMSYVLDDDFNYFSNNPQKIIELDDRLVNIYENSQNKKLIAEIYENDLSVCVYCDLSEQELIKIAEKIY